MPGAGPVGPQMIASSTLGSGLRIVSESMTDVRSVALGFWVGVGARDEPAAEAGASHFLEHLLFKGTSTRSAQEIAEVIEAVGGEMNAFTARDHTAFFVRLLAEDLELGLDVLCDIMWDPAFRPAEVDAERQVILEEILMLGDEPGDLVQELLAEALWPDHPLGREVLGDPETVTAMSVGAIRSFHDRHYRPSTMVFAAAGRLEHEHLRAGIDRRFAATARQGGGSAPVRMPPAEQPRPLVVQNRKTEQTHIALGIPWLDRHDPDRHAATLLVHILGGGASSRLFQEVRERRGLAYSVYAYRSGYDDAGVAAIYAGSAPGRAAETLRVIVGEVERLAEGVTDRELEVARGNVVGSMALGLEDSGARMARIGRSALLHTEVPTVEGLAERFASIGPSDLRRVAERLLVAPRSVAVVGPVSRTKVERWLA
ncbi:MAG: pitrilysin family protein [Acidimicrobiales bacterium]